MKVADDGGTRSGRQHDLPPRRRDGTQSGGLELKSYAAESPLLLMTSFSPTGQVGGSVMLRSLLGEEPSPAIVWGTLATQEAPAPGRTVHRRGRRSPWLLPPRRMAAAVDALARWHGAAAIWVVAHGALVPAVSPLVRGFGWPVHLSVHDDPAWAGALRSRRLWPLTPWLSGRFAAAVGSATSIDVISGGMRGELARRFGADSFVINRYVEGPVKPSPSYEPRSGLSIGIVGTVYHPRQLETLSDAVGIAARRLDVAGRVTIIGPEVPGLKKRAAAVSGVEVTFLGHQPEPLDVLRTVFALYLGYPFGPRARMLRRTSFPTKLATYLLAARPLLLHTPHDSTLTALVDAAPYTLPWFDDDASSGACQLVQAWRNEAMHLSQHRTAEEFRERYFGVKNRARLSGALDRLPQ